MSSGSAGLSESDAAVVRRAEELEQMWDGIHREEAELVAKWASTITRNLVLELDRKLAAGEDLTGDEDLQWATAVRLTRPRPDAPEAIWDRWYETPISRMLPALPRGPRGPRPSASAT